MSQTLLAVNWIATIAVIVYTVYLCVYLIRTRISYIKLGKKAEFDNNVKKRLHNIWTYVFGQKKLLKDKKSGIMHVVIFYGFILVQFGAIDFIWKGLSPGSHLPFGAFYPYFTFMQELVTLAVIVAVLYAFYRRYIEKLVRLKKGWKNSLVVIFIATLMITVLLGNGMTMIWFGEQPNWSQPVASLIFMGFSWIGETASIVGFYFFWWVHLLVLLVFLVYIPQSKHAHLIAAPANVYLYRLDKPGKLRPIDFEDETQESFGVGKIDEFTQLQLVDLYACVECGRCTNFCPATGTGKMLSPMDLIVKMRDHLTNYGAAVTSKTPWVPSFMFKNTVEEPIGHTSPRNGCPESAAAIYDKSLIGDVITEEEIWACTTCRNCEDNVRS